MYLQAREAHAGPLHAGAAWLNEGCALGEGVGSAVGDRFSVVGAAVWAHDEREAPRALGVRLGEE